MDRFAFKIDNALKANLCKICRLCGVDHPFMVPILSNVKKSVLNTNEPDLYQKIYELIGFTIHRNDNMPQRACAPCVDKINDFFDFRDMCYNTEAQTRKLLGLKCDGLNKDIENVLAKRGRKRKAEDIILDKPELPQPSNKKGKLKDIKIVKKLQFICNICQEEFDNDKKLKVHLIIKHDPFIPRYFCYACDHVLNLPIDVKNHDIWHKVTKTPLICGFCDAKLNNRSAFNKHMRTLHGKLDLSAKQLVLERKCPGCKEIHLTPFLYNMHKCALQTSQCGGCNQTFRQQIEIQRHVPKCAKAYNIYSQNIPIVEDIKTSLPLDEGIRIKNEADVVDADRILAAVELSETRHCSKKSESSKHFKRVDDLLRVTMNTLESIKQEPEIHMENNNNNRWQNEDYNYNNQSQFQDDVDDDDDDDDNNDDRNQQMPNEPIVQLSEGTSIVNCNEGPEVNELPIPRLKIKKEHGTLNSSVINNDEQMQTNKNDTHQYNEEGDVNVINSNRMSVPGMLNIKQERMEEEISAAEAHSVWNNISSGGDSEAMGLSSIRISNVTSGIEFNDELGQDEQQGRTNESNTSTSLITQDIKPNIAELNKSLNGKKRQSISSAQSRVVVKTEPLDRGILPRITSVTAGVNMSAFHIKTEIKSEPNEPYENYENHMENVWQPPENITIKQECVSIKQESTGRLHIPNNVDTGVSYNTDHESHVDKEANKNEVDDEEVILLDSPPPFINLEPDMEIINLDSPDPVINEETDMEVLNNPAVRINTVDPEINNIKQINETENINKADTENENLENEGETDKIKESSIAEVLENKGEAEECGNIQPLESKEETETIGHVGVLEDEKEAEEINSIESLESKEETETIGHVGVLEDEKEAEEINSIESLESKEETEKFGHVGVLEDEEEAEEMVNKEANEIETLKNKEESEEVCQSRVLEDKEEAEQFGNIESVENKEEEEIDNSQVLDNEREEEKEDGEIFENKLHMEEEEKLTDAKIIENGDEIFQGKSEFSNLAQPFQESDFEEDESNSLAEQQNEINQQMDSEMSEAQEITKLNIEEVENVLNERVDPASQVPSFPNTNAMSSSTSISGSYSNNALLFTNNRVPFDNNINEIAENNNNANIERELLEVNATEATVFNIQSDECL